MQLGNLAFGQCNEADAGQAQSLIETGDILLVAGQAVERLGEHDIEAAVANRLEHRLIAGAEGARARDRRVAIDLLEAPALAGDPLLAEADLVVN
jgi:hypothetical protein